MLITSSAATSKVLRKIEREATAVVPLEQVTQRCSEAFYEAFQESIVLVRMFITLPYGQLPAEERVFADGVAQKKNVQGAVPSDSLALTLLGTRGTNPAWSDRRVSQSYRAIPLVSVALVESMPMTAKLFRTIDPNLSWLAAKDHKIAEKAWGAGPAGLFFVEDAATSLDAQGRKVIPVQGFVQEYGVKTVFGIARSYRERVLFAMLVFLRHSMSRERGRDFFPIATTLRSPTLRAIDAGTVFSQTTENALSPLAQPLPSCSQAAE